MIEYFGQGRSVTAVSLADLGQFFKSAPNNLKTPQDAYLGAKIFLHYSCPTILIVDFGYVVSPTKIFQKCTK